MSNEDQSGSEKADIIIGCQCGKNWWLDYQPTPEGCEGDIWRLGTVVDDNGESLYIEWGAWVDQNGNEVYIRPSVWTEAMLGRVIVYLADFLDYTRGQDRTRHYPVPDDVADCIEWARMRYGSK